MLSHYLHLNVYEYFIFQRIGSLTMIEVSPFICDTFLLSRCISTFHVIYVFITVSLKAFIARVAHKLC
jgi:hypothetical protein